MRLLIASTDFPPAVGGTQTYAFQLACRLSRRCEHVAVVVPSPSSGCTTAIDDTVGFPVFRAPGSPSLFPLSGSAIISRIARSGRYDAVFCVSWQAALAARIARLFGGPRLIIMAAHGRELLMNPAQGIPLVGAAYNAIRRFGMAGATRFFPVSRHTRMLLLRFGIDPSRIQVLSNGTDPETFRPENDFERPRTSVHDTAPVLLSVGRLVRRKGVDVMLRAFPEVVSRYPNAVYIVVGNGPERYRLEQLSRRLHIDNHVHFLDEQPPDRLRSIYNSCDVFVLPVRELEQDVEGFGLVFLEASACAKPVVGTRSGGVPDAVVDGKTGLLVPSEDPVGLARAVVRILDDPHLARRLGDAGRHHVLKNANWDAIASSLYASVKSAVNEERRSQQPATSQPARISFFRF